MNRPITFSSLFLGSGPECLTKLQEPDLRGNQITAVKGLEQLANLKKLCLGDNRLEEIRGWEASLASKNYALIKDS